MQDKYFKDILHQSILSHMPDKINFQKSVAGAYFSCLKKFK